MSMNLFMTLNFSSCILSAMEIFSCSSLRFSSLNSLKNSIISDADDFDLRRFFFFAGWSLFRGNCSGSSSSVLSAESVPPEAAIEETVEVGTTLGSYLKKSVSSSWNSHSFLSFPVRLLCSWVFLNLSSNFFHLLEHCSPVTLTLLVELNFSATLAHATFFRIFPFVNRLSFSRRSEIKSRVLLVDHVMSFVVVSSSSSSPTIV